MRVLMLLENNPYGEDWRVRQEAAALVKGGHSVTVICPRPRGSSQAKPSNDKVRVVTYPAPPGGRGLLTYVWEFAYSTVAIFVLSLIVWSRSGIDVVHAHNPPDTLVIIGAFYKIFGKRFVFDHHDLSPEMYAERFGIHSNRRIAQLLLWFEKLTFRLADHVIATNESYAEIAQTRGRVDRARITIVRNGPNYHVMAAAEPVPELRDRARILIGFSGIMGPQDGVDLLVRSVYHLVADLGYLDLLCVIIGKGDTFEDLVRLSADLGINDHTLFTGWLSYEDLSRHLATVDICVDPDPYNDFNDRSTMIKMMEYMALGKPIVAFDLREHRVSAGESALYATGNDPRDLAKRIAELIDDPERRERMGMEGVRRVRDSLSWQHQVPHLLDAYAGLRRKARG